LAKVKRNPARMGIAVRKVKKMVRKGLIIQHWFLPSLAKVKRNQARMGVAVRQAVLRIWIQGLFDPCIRNMGWVKSKDPDPGSGMNNLELRNHFLC
jgi:hypothetical protein